MSEGEKPGTHEVTGVLCMLAVEAGVIQPPTLLRVGDDITWMYRGDGDDYASCIAIPLAVLRWAGMELGIGDVLAIDGICRTWTGHMDAGVRFGAFADALEVDGKNGTTNMGEVSAA